MSSYLAEVRELKGQPEELFGKISTIRIAIIALGDYCIPTHTFSKNWIYTRPMTKLLNSSILVVRLVAAMLLSVMNTHCKLLERLIWRASTKAKRCVVLIGMMYHTRQHTLKTKKNMLENELTELASMKITTAVQCGSNSRANYF